MIKKSVSYQDQVVWQISIGFVKDIYKITEQFPSSEVYGLTNQIRRAAISIPSNIAEGQGRNSSKEFRQFLSITLGSLAEIETQLIIAKEIGYLPETILTELSKTTDRIRKMLRSLSNSLKSPTENRKPKNSNGLVQQKPF